MIRAGRKDRKITIQRATEARDAIGGVTETWSDHLVLWAEVVPVSGKEALEYDRNVSSRTSRFIVHFLDDITREDRISYDGDSWNIRFLRELGRRRELEITAEVIE